MASRKSIAERILRILQGGEVTIDTDIDIREIMLHVDSERDSIIQEKLVEAYKPMSQRSVQAPAAYSILGNYVTEDTYSVSDSDPVRGQKYVLLTAYPIDLPDGAGIVYVKDGDDHSVVYSGISPAAESLYSSLPSYAASNKIYYTLVQDRIYFSHDNPSKATVGLVAISSGLSDTAMYPLSPGDESRIIKSVIDLYNLMNTVKQDFINDNIDQ